MAQNINPESQSHSSNLAKQSEDVVMVKDTHAVSKR